MTPEAAPPTEWIAGRLTMPGYVTEPGDEPYRPDVVVWFELPDELIVGSRLVGPDASPEVFVQALEATVRAPAAGPPRKPDRIRVADPIVASALREAVGATIEVIVGDVPELGPVQESLHEEVLGGADEAAGSAEGPSYLEDGRIEPDLVRKLFVASDLFQTSEPWRVFDEVSPLRMDIPSLGVRSACVTVIGAMDQVQGVMVFPSLEAFEGWIAVVQQHAQDGEVRPGATDFGTQWLSFDLRSALDLPPRMRREAMAHAWPVGSLSGYPAVMRHDRDGVLRPIEAADLELVCACLETLSELADDTGTLPPGQPISSELETDDGVAVTWAFPYEAEDPVAKQLRAFAEGVARGAHGALDAAAAAAPKLGRNDPCHCGSGKKYKKCHLAEDEAARR